MITSPTWSPRGRYRYWDVWFRPRTARSCGQARGMPPTRGQRVPTVCSLGAGDLVRVGTLIDGCEAFHFAFDFAFARGFQRVRIRRKLQHRSGLSDAKPCQQHHLSTRKFQCIVVFVGAVEIDLPEARDVLFQFPPFVQPERVVAFDILLKTQLGAGNQAHGPIRLPYPPETPAQQIPQLPSHNLLTTLRRP